MISVKDRSALTRHEVVGLLEEAIHSTEQYWGNCYLVDQLSMLAYRIAEGEAGFVENEEEVIMGGHNSSDAGTGIIETMLDGYEAMTEGWISQSHFRSAVSELSNDEVIEVIGLAWFYRAGWLEEEARRGAERSGEDRTYSHTVVDGSGIRCGNCSIYNKTLITSPRDKPARTHTPKGDNLEIDTEMLKDKVEALMRNRVRQKPKPKPEETKNTTETIMEGLEKGILALNLIAELYSKERGKAQRMTEQSDGNRDTNRRKLVYVAGPYQGNTKENIENAEKVSIELIRRGFDVVTPHKNTAGYERYEDGSITRSTWLDMALNILSRCDAIFVIDGSSASEGTAAEIAFAKENNIPLIKAEMKMNNGKEDDELMAFLSIIKGIEDDPEAKRRMEEDQREYGTLTGEDLIKRFTI